MSGIVGHYRPASRVDADSLAEGMQRLSHRGPDGAGTWCGGPVALGHQQLQSTPESRHVAPPLVDEDAGLVVTADARLDNRASLLDALGMPTSESRTITDHELLLAAYDQWGERCPEHLVGAFAVAIWDRDRKRLFCTRDHIGIKPFYYADGEDRFVFASEPKGVLADPTVSSVPDEVRIGDYLVSLYEDTERTWYRDLSRLPPAHTLTIDATGLSTRRYWRLDPTRELHLDSAEDYTRAFRDRFTEAVRCRLRRAGPVGTLLSGGLDSSSIACIARAELPDDQPLHTISARFESVPESDEGEFIDAVLDSGAFTPHTIAADQLSPLGDEQFRQQHDGPIHSPNHFLHWAFHRTAHDNGVRVLLDGLDGDTTLSHGRGHMAALARRGQWRRLLTEVTGFADRFDRPVRQVLFRRVLEPLAPQVLRQGYRHLEGSDPVSRLNPTVDTAFAAAIGLQDRVHELTPGSHRPARTAREDHHRRLSSGLIPHILELVDMSAAAFGVEPRYPFFDKRLVEFCLALPPEQKLDRGWTRVIMRRALEDQLPDTIRWRGGKADLSPNFYRSLLRDERDTLTAVIEEEPDHIEPYLDIESLQGAYRAYADAGEGEAGMYVWKAVTLDRWLGRVTTQ